MHGKQTVKTVLTRGKVPLQGLLNGFESAQADFAVPQNDFNR